MNFFKRILNMIFSRDEIKKAFGIEAPPEGAMPSAIQKWAELYISGKLQLPTAVCSELARLTAVEMKIKIQGSGHADYLNNCLEGELPRLRRQLPRALALGTMVIKPYYDGQRMRVEYVAADSFTPMKWEDGRLTGAVFAQKLQRDGKYYTRLERHQLQGTDYTIQNAAYESGNSTDLGRPVSLTAIPEWAKLTPEATITNVKAPLFGVFRNPAPNTLDPSSPLGMSVFAAAERVIAEAEKLFCNLLWEFESGRRKLYVDITALDRDTKGKPILPDTDLFRTIDANEGGFFQEWSPEFRNEAMQSGMNVLLRRVEFITGLAYGTLSEVSEVDKTAEEIRASKQRSYATVCDLQRELRTAIEDMVYAMSVWAKVYNLSPGGNYEITAEFDDSIVADRKTEYAEKLQLVSAGIMQPWEFRMWYFGEDEKTAKEAIPLDPNLPFGG